MDLSKRILVLALGIAFLLSAALLAQGFSFQGPSNRFVTPNGDHKNDNVAFTFYNPAWSEVTGKIYDISGRFVADTTPPRSTDLNGKLTWNAKSGSGEPVRTGMYVYVITCESSVFRGAVVVLR